MKGSTNTSKEEVKNSSLIKAEMNQLGKVNAEYTAAQKSFMKGLINPDLTDSELMLFVKYAEGLKLSPFRKEIIAVVYKGSAGRTVNTIVTKDGKMTIASRTGELDSIFTEAIYVKEKKTPVNTLDAEGKVILSTLPEVAEITKVQAWEGGKLWGGFAAVTRKGKTFTVTVPLSEYTTGRSVWSTKPSTMIKKVALSQALTMAFPEILGGVYDESEMGMTDIKSLPVTENDSKPATDIQLNTIKSLGSDAKPETYGQAAQLIKGLSTQKK